MIEAVIINLKNSAGILLVIGLVTAFFAGTRLFIVLENCFSIIFRLPSRNVIWQNIMAFGMLALYLLLIIALLLISLIPRPEPGHHAAFRHSITGARC